MTSMQCQLLFMILNDQLGGIDLLNSSRGSSYVIFDSCNFRETNGIGL